MTTGQFARRLIGWLAVSLLSLVLTIASVVVTRPYQAEVGNVCQKTVSNTRGICYAPLPAGGFPFAYLYDFGGVSVQGKLGFGEDRFVTMPFVVDWILINLVLAVLIWSAQLWIRPRN